VLESRDRLWLIDYEYAGFGTAMFDLASAASNAKMSDDDAASLLESYLGQPPDAQFMTAFDAMRCAALIREAMWAMVSDLHLSTPGVDFKAYAAENLTALDAMLDTYQSSHGKLHP
jgi:thiamine kinase-like enzyme